MFKFVVFSALLAVALAADIPFETCSGWPAPTSVTIPECPASPCDFGNGDSFTLNFSFDAANQITALPVHVTVEHDGNVSVFPLPTGDACTVVAGGCPTGPGSVTVSFPVTLAGLSSGVSTVTVELSDQAGNNVACGRVTTDFN